MLARLSIRDIVLIDRLDIDFALGLSVLTGETGAGKSILLDAFALALGGRGDATLVRHGAEQGQVTAVFDVPKGHPATSVLSDNGLDDTGEMILRRVQFADGRTRAFVNDQPVSAQALKALGAALVEIHGQHDERALIDVATHRRLLDAYGGLEARSAEVERLWHERRAREGEVAAHRAEVERARREADFLRHAVEDADAAGFDVGEDLSVTDRYIWPSAADQLVRHASERQKQEIKTLYTKSVANQRVQELARDYGDLLLPHLWSGITKVRPGAGIAVVGNPVQCAEMLQQFIEAGCHSFCLSGYLHDEEAERFGRLVRPILATNNRGRLTV